MLESDWRVSKVTREIENKKQTARKELEDFRRRSKTKRSKEAAEFRKRLGNFKTRSKPLEND